MTLLPSLATGEASNFKEEARESVYWDALRYGLKHPQGMPPG